MPAGRSARVMRRIRVKGGNVIDVEVKVIRDRVLYVACEDTGGLKQGKKAFCIRKGAVLVRRTNLDREGVPYFMIFNDGIYAAIRSQGFHVPDTQDLEKIEILCYRETLEWALQQTWYLNSRSSAEEIAAYEERTGSVSTGLRKVVDDDKRRARTQSGRGANPTDALGRTNFTSRSPIVWSADLALCKRTGTVHRIRPRISVRNGDLLALADEAWKVKTDFEREIVQALRWGSRGVRALNADDATRMAVRLEKLAGSLRSVSIAPYSRRGFPRIASDLDRVVVALRAGNYEAARKLLDRCRRSFVLVDGRRILEQTHTVASRVEKAHIELTKQDKNGLVDVIDHVRDLLVIDGVPVDHDFENPVVARSVAHLDAARALALEVEFDPKAFCDAIEAGTLPL